MSIPRIALFSLLAALVAASVSFAEEKKSGPERVSVYFGTYTGPKSKGIYRADFDLSTGRLGPVELAGELTNPSFIAIHTSHKYLYAANEVGSIGGKKTGGVSAMAVDSKTGKLTLLNQESSQGTGPCFVAVDREGKNALAANYGSGSVACLPIRDDGRLGEATSAIQHEGKSVDPRRQEGPHAHSINLDPAGRFALACDLGLDKIFVYRLDAAAGKLTPAELPWATVAPGAGPRHLAFHPSGKFAYVINELNSTVTAFTYDADRGALSNLQSVSTLPNGFKGTNYPADIHVHPSGKFLYGSNRGHDSIAIFAIDAKSGKLRPVGREPTQGKNPRNFNIDPSGRYLLAANQDSDNIVVFRVDAATGKLQPTGAIATISKPVCIQFLGRP